MKLKVCGMKYNMGEVAALAPDYLGFIFWNRSSRFFDVEMPLLPPNIKKVGVFVDAQIDEILATATKFGLDVVQLHGNEGPDYCLELKERANRAEHPIEVIKVFSVKDRFDFSVLEDYETCCDFYLFDTKGKLPGGNGYTFDWKVLAAYPSTKPYFLSGGIGLEDIDGLRSFLQKKEAGHCHAIDVNSRFEIEPGLKDISRLREFKQGVSPLKRGLKDV